MCANPCISRYHAGCRCEECRRISREKRWQARWKDRAEGVVGVRCVLCGRWFASAWSVSHHERRIHG